MHIGMAELGRRTADLRTRLAIVLNLMALTGFGLAFIDCVASLARSV